MKRAESVDIVRGLVMIIMALDHTRDLIHIDALTQQPTDLTTASPALFFTRWITHLCAPTFIFLSGVSAYFSIKNQDHIARSRKRLLIRGLLLILLDFTVVNFGLWFDPNFDLFLFNVLAAIGFGFIALALFINLPSVIIGLIGMIIILTYPLLITSLPEGSTLANKVITSFFSPGAFPMSDGKLFIMGYPPLPWLAIMFVGYSCGKFFSWDKKRRTFLFLSLGLACLTLFTIIRILNTYGDPLPWSVQKTALYTTLSFLNITKYPPSLLFDLSMLGIMFILLACAEKMRNKVTLILSVYGKAPLLYFLLHWYIIHPILFLILFAQGYGFNDMVFGTNFGRPKGVSGLDLTGVYLVWIFVVIALYPICKWYGKYKETAIPGSRLSRLP